MLNQLHMLMAPACNDRRDNLLEDLAPWKSRKLTALDFLNLLHEIDTTWFEYRRHFIAIVAIRNNKFTWWAYPKARKWCTSRVRWKAAHLSTTVISPRSSPLTRL